MSILLDITSLKLADLLSLHDLPPNVLRTILSHIDTAQSVAHLAASCKKLYEAVASHGWRIFVQSQFGSLALPERLENNEWAALADKLTWQSRAWDRRAFVMASLLPDTEEQSIRYAQKRGRGSRGYGRGRGRGRGRGGARGNGHRSKQTMPPHAIVDACLERDGGSEVETLAWGLGEDVVVRWRCSQRSALKNERWSFMKGAPLGLKSGPDDVTAISILNDVSTSQSLLVGRASGGLQLLSGNQDDFGHIVASFVPASTSLAGQALEQSEIQHFTASAAQEHAAVITKSNLFVYPLCGRPANPSHASGRTDLVIESTEALNIGSMSGSSSPFLSLRQICFMGDGNLALCVNRSADPVRHIARTPAGTTLVNAAKMRPSRRCREALFYGDDYLHNARGLLPVDMASIPGGSGGAVLSSYDDGTVRLQDVRTPAPFDAIYQDHFEMVAPMGPLVAYGKDRFIVGSARATILKVFDFRWTKGYCYVEAMPCSEQPLEPLPKSLTDVPAPLFAVRGQCCHVSGRSCTLHALARTDFYRPNCNVYLPVLKQTAGPVYSLAKPSDLSAVVYAGLTRGLAKISLRDPATDVAESAYVQHMDSESRCGYSYCQDLSNMVETGDGIGLDDISKSKRLPSLHKQKRDKLSAAFCKRYRLDESLI